MKTATAQFSLPDSDATERLAGKLAPRLRAGDTILLVGPIGAGKTHFARSVILALLADHEDVPSPTFTIVQTYESAQAQIWHADLYRLSSPNEVVELGLTDAFQSSICLVEWPDRLGDLSPESALNIAFEPDAQSDLRHVVLSWHDPKWRVRLKGIAND